MDLDGVTGVYKSLQCVRVSESIGGALLDQQRGFFPLSLGEEVFKLRLEELVSSFQVRSHRELERGV